MKGGIQKGMNNTNFSICEIQKQRKTGFLKVLLILLVNEGIFVYATDT